METANTDEPDIPVPASLTLAAGEMALGAWICGVPNTPTSGVVKYEGHLVLTNRRIVYEPMRSPKFLDG